MVLGQTKKFKLILTEKCNWDCEYCFRKEYPKSNSDNTELIYEIVPYLASLSEDIYFTGGEVGLLDEDLLDFLFYHFQHCKIRLATNGTWFKTKSYQKYKDLDLSILYHSVMNLDDDIEFLDIPKAKYNFVIYENNIDKVSGFLERYKNIIFYPLLDLRKKVRLDRKIYKEIYNILINFDNIPKQISEAVKLMYSDDEKWKGECIKNKPLRISVNFPHNLISSCCRLDVGIEISKNNITKIINDDVQLPIDSNVCNFCATRYLTNSREITDGVL